ncbi:AbrB/MazE/SpoVT family DNA-binding domain-containing protein [Pseudomonas sp. BLCC-B112]|uniref:AbrB/MazE/SpoVT family DNA-binding domain-containing protein n=1 Tax=Pseudomonas sp. BLCC-B112 TaxID=3025319 RepID=UPI003FA7AD7D
MKTTVVCQDSADGSGDVIIDLPPEILSAIGVGLGELLSIELVNGSIVLKPIHDIDSKA